MSKICSQYDKIAQAYDQTRTKDLMEEPYLAMVAGYLPKNGQVLDLGCGSAEPIAQYFIDRGYSVTGVDGSEVMLKLCRQRYPQSEWLFGDMRQLNLQRRFDAVIAWDSFFHLSQDDQRSMFPIFAAHLVDGGVLLFTSGTEDGEITNPMHGQDIYHASLSTQEYQQRLADNGFSVALHKINDPACGHHTIWLAQAGPEPAE